MRRLSLVFLPFLAAFALVFGLYYLYAAYRLVRLGRVVPAALVFVFGCVGVGLAVAIWVTRKRVGRGGGAPPASSSGPPA
jgi:predicted PurR-regulated permease PerM